MKTKSIITYISLATSVFFASCSDSFLDRPALSAVTSENFYKTAGDLEKATASLYSGSIWGAWTSDCYLPLGEVLGGNMILGYNGPAVELNTFSLNGYNFNLITEWRSMYNLIAPPNRRHSVLYRWESLATQR